MNRRKAKKRKKYKSLQEYYFGIFGIKPKDWSQIRWTRQYMERKTYRSRQMPDSCLQKRVAMFKVQGMVDRIIPRLWIK